MPIEIDALGSRRFGTVLARTTDPAATPLELNAAADRLGVAMLATRIDCADHARIHALEHDGHRLMDTLVHWTRCLNTPPAGPATSTVAVRPATREDASAVGAVARAAFRNYLGHFHSDPNLETSSADDAYVDWAVTSVRTLTPQRPALIAEETGQIRGFLTLNQTAPDVWDIVLNAVDPAAQGRGIYGALVDGAIAHALAASKDPARGRIVTSTQLINYPVQRAWAARGFRIERAIHTFHKWYPSPSRHEDALA